MWCSDVSFAALPPLPSIVTRHHRLLSVVRGIEDNQAFPHISRRFGVLLVVAYGIGMALALVGTGLVLVKPVALTRALPSLTAVVVVGAGMRVVVRSVLSM